jgi:spore maturation protein CgeB
MRLFEATGMGALLLTEAAPNLGELFVPGQEVGTYAGADELVARIRALLDDEDRRAAIAAAGQRRTLADHTYERRMVELDRILRERWPD